MSTAPDSLFEVVTVHCFRCAHTVSDPSPQGAHDLMEQHYAKKHAGLIARICAEVAL